MKGLKKVASSKAPMPIGYSKTSSKLITAKEAKKTFNDLLPTANLTPQQKIDLTIAICQYGPWEECYSLEDELLTATRAIEEIKKQSLTGKKLVDMTISGLDLYYSRLNPEKNQKSNEPLLKLTSIKEKELHFHVTTFSISIFNLFKNTINIYKQTQSSEWVSVCSVPGQNTEPVVTPPIDYIGQVFEARLYTDATQYTVVGAYLAYPGNTTWDVVTFDPGNLTPSCYYAPLSNPNITLNNNLFTYIEIQQVLNDGSLHWVGALPPGASTTLLNGYVGVSIIITQGETIINNFVVERDVETIWNVSPITIPLSAASFPTGGNNYLSCATQFSQIGSGDFTIVCTALIECFGTWNTVWSLSGSGFKIYVDADSMHAYPEFVVSLDHSADQVVQATTSMNANQYYQLCIVRTGSTYNFYVDGELAATTNSLTVPSLTSLSLTVGGTDFASCVRNVGIWSRALSVGEIQQTQDSVANLGDNLIGFWTLNDTLLESSGKNLPLIVNGQSSFVPCYSEVYIQSENNYAFYQVCNPQNDLVAAQNVSLQKSIIVGDNSPYLYAGFDDATDMYFTIPEGMTLQIQYTDYSGHTTVYNQNSNTEDLYVLMSADLKSVYHFCIKNPPAGIWTISMTGQTSSAFRFQFQTIPTTDVHNTIKQALLPVFENEWSHQAVKGLTNILTKKPHPNQYSQDEYDEVEFILIIGALVAAAVLMVAIVISTETVHTVESTHKDKEDANDAVHDTFKSPPAGIKNVLLVDANGADSASKTLYNYRLKKLYPKVLSGVFRNNNSQLVGSNDTQTNLATALIDPNLIYVSAGGHGRKSALCGYTTTGISPWTAVLTVDQVNANPSLASNKVFHFLACLTGSAGGIGQTLVNKGAIAFIGYSVPHTSNMVYTSALAADIEIDLALLEGKTVQQAYNAGKTAYQRKINQALYGENPHPAIAAELQTDMAALVFYGNGSATICSGG